MIKRLAILFVIVFILYLPSLFFGWTYLDDNVLVLEHFKFLKNWNNFFLAFQKEVFSLQNSAVSYYRPFLTVSFMLDATFWNKEIFGYHLTNVLIHLVCCGELYLLLLHLLKSQTKEVAAFFFTLCFAVHPVLTQAIAWIPGRNDSLLALFVLASFLFFIQYLSHPSVQNFVGQMTFHAFGVFTKESGVLLPFLAGLYFLFFWSKDKRQRNKTFPWLLLAIDCLISLGFFLIRSQVLTTGKGMTVLRLIISVGKNLPAVLLYLGKFFLPVNLSVMPVLPDSNLIFGAIVLIAILAFGVFAWKKNKLNFKTLIFGFSWFLVFLLPAFARPNSDLLADFLEHRSYLPLIGIIFWLAWETESFFQSANSQWFFLIPAVFSAVTFVHSFSFRNRLVFWQRAAASSPSYPLTIRNLGVMYYLEGNSAMAKKYYLKTLSFAPNEPMVHNNLGIIAMDRGDLETAEKEFRTELKINPNYDKAFFNLGWVFYQKENFDNALLYWEKTILVNPNYGEAWLNLIRLAESMGYSDKLQKYRDYATQKNINFKEMKFYGY